MDNSARQRARRPDVSRDELLADQRRRGGIVRPWLVPTRQGPTPYENFIDMARVRLRWGKPVAWRERLEALALYLHDCVIDRVHKHEYQSRWTIDGVGSDLKQGDVDAWIASLGVVLIGRRTPGWMCDRVRQICQTVDYWRDRGAL